MSLIQNRFLIYFYTHLVGQDYSVASRLIIWASAGFVPEAISISSLRNSNYISKLVLVKNCE